MRTNAMVQPTGTARAPHTDATGARLGMWLFLFTELLFFGGMFLLYAVYRARYAAGFHAAAAEENTLVGAGNTALLLTSSLALALAVTALRQGRTSRSLFAQGATILMGAGFLSVKSLEWLAKIGQGVYPGSADLLRRSHGEVLFFGLYFVMTGIHGIHVLIGIVLIAVTFALTARGRISARRYGLLENTALFWHFVDVVWIYLFPLFYLVT
jgi:cytochrome c oxidase subunit 3